MCDVLLPPGVNPIAVKHTHTYIYIYISYIQKQYGNINHQGEEILDAQDTVETKCTHLGQAQAIKFYLAKLILIFF
jgi:ABC-type transport system involved in cytochrome c biogenesis ATPase subunit